MNKKEKEALAEKIFEHWNDEPLPDLTPADEGIEDSTTADEPEDDDEDVADK